MALEGIFQSVAAQLLHDRQTLLDLTTRNRLIHLPLRTRNIRVVEIVDEKSAEVCRQLMEGKSLSFLPGRVSKDGADETDGDAADLALAIAPPPGEEVLDEIGRLRRHTDNKLHTRLTSEGLQKRLFDIWYDARTLEEEQGVNVLYLALGLLKWFEDDNSETERFAPLVLLPVKIDRTSAADRFFLRSRGETASSNLSLQAKLNAEFGIKLEDLADDDEIDLTGYLERVADTVANKKRWEVQPDAMALGFFSFSKFLMYRDLDPQNWPKDAPLDKNAVIASLLRDGFEQYEPVVADGAKIDPVIPPANMHHVVDADSSQTVAIEEVMRGNHIVIKGPPGTGKSQTITNILAAAAAQGRKVLFVAEKMAALDVVHRRLKTTGLSSLTLELHSNKINKKVVLAELKRTKDLSMGPVMSDTTVIQRLTDARDELNAHAEMMHVPHRPSELTPYQLMGRLVEIRRSDGEGGYALDRPERWAAADVDRRRRLLSELLERTQAMGLPHHHPWRGVARDALDPIEDEELSRKISATSRALVDAIRAAGDAPARYGLGQLETVGQLTLCLHALEAAMTLPLADRRPLGHAVWGSVKQVEECVQRGEKFQRMAAAVGEAFKDVAWQASLNESRAIIAKKGGSLFRIFSSAYRSSIALLRSNLKVPLPKSLDARLLLLDGLLAGQEARRRLEEVENVGSQAFGDAWHGVSSDWQSLRATTTWWVSHNEKLGTSFLHRLSTLPLPATDRSAATELGKGLPSLLAGLSDLFAFLQLNIREAFGADDIADIPLSALIDRLTEWELSQEKISRWIAFTERAKIGTDLGLESVVRGLIDGRLSPSRMLATFDRVYFEAMRTQLFAQHPNLKKFDGEHQSRLVSEFRTLDAARMQLARGQLAAYHVANLPRAGGGIGPLGVLNGEFAKKRNHLPIRQLLDRAGAVIQQLKPIFMMSPLSVAQFLKPGAISFDLLVVDEASQILPVDALGAIARCRQIVVVGDERQLPPTNFFSKLTSNTVDGDQDEDSPTFQAKDAESVLDLCIAKSMPHRMLNWHYRSKHQSLIAVSNKQFYDNKLFIVPSPYDAVAGMGLKFNYLPHATYDRGNTRINADEAKAVAEAVIRHAKESPDQSLGVATFSVVQRQAVLKELELLRRQHPQAEDFFSPGGNEPFFVKNLENIQGDERDVILISVGYGRAKGEAYLPMSFGPLNLDGGERRLNVLISRAKLRCEVFSSIKGEEIDLDRAKSAGAAALKLFLTFAETGKLDFKAETGREADSVFEEQVALALKNRGYDVRNQIGSAGFFVDLAIADKEKPGRFILGIECDGAQYHSSRSARDRDRLRQSVLEAHGWIIHRIWSTDWFLRPADELSKVIKAIENAKAAWRELDLEAAKPKAAVPLTFTTHTEDDTEILTGVIGEVDTIEAPPLATRYIEAQIAVRRGVEPHEISVGEMARYVTSIVSAEGPIHESEIIVRIRNAWGLARSGNRIRDAVLSGIAWAQQSGSVAGKQFYQAPGQAIVIRDRSDASLSLRKPETLPPVEIEAAVRAILAANFGAKKEQLVQELARTFGFASTSSQLRLLLEGVIADLVTRNELQSSDEGVITLEARPA